MRPIRVLTPNFELLGEIDTYQSLIFTMRWHSTGEFQLVINRHMAYTDTLQKGNLIWLYPDPRKAGIILYRGIQLDERGKVSENWEIRGVTLDGITQRGHVVPPEGMAYDRTSGNAESVMKHYVNSTFITPQDTKKIISQIAVAPSQNRGENIRWQARYGRLDEELERISYLTGLGWHMQLDWENQKWLFDVQEGTDRTADQNVHPPVIFSPEFDSVRMQSFFDSDIGYANVAYVAGQGEGEERRIVVVGDAEGLDRFELFVDARDIAEEDEEGNPRPEEEIIADLEQRGREKLAEHARELSFEAQIMTPITGKEHDFAWLHPAHLYMEERERLISPFVYEHDWFLGDIVTVQNKDWGVTMNARITEIREIYEPSGFRLEAVFGNSVPTFIEKLKQALSQLENEVRR